MSQLLIVGSGLAGYTLAREVRKLDEDMTIVVVTADDGRFYSKPMLSNALAKGLAPARLASASAAKMADDHGLRIETDTRVQGVDVQARTVTTEDGELSYDHLVLATGAIPISPPLQGNAVAQVLTVNNLADYARFHERVEKARRVALIGPGLIGCEFANDLAVSGRAVTVIGPDPHPLGRLLPPIAGRFLHDRLEEAGIEWRLGLTATAVDEGADGTLAVTLSDGAVVEADLVLSAIGLQPDTTLARQAGLACGRGITVDAFLNSSAPHVYALGDCIEMDGQVLPFVMPIMHGARALARTLTGERSAVRYPPMPVVVKTPACPLVLLPPPAQAEGRWEEETRDGGVRARFVGAEGELLGFALAGSAVGEKGGLLKACAGVGGGSVSL
ncbi:MAG TPA: FAD-dependent oxidoreductase [Gammaproteobacteria bacterium]|nr:FAD-dependent oxidoreductase [Gammaproteobacteria bacterium]